MTRYNEPMSLWILVCWRKQVTGDTCEGASWLWNSEEHLLLAWQDQQNLQFVIYHWPLTDRVRCQIFPNTRGTLGSQGWTSGEIRFSARPRDLRLIWLSTDCATSYMTQAERCTGMYIASCTSVVGRLWLRFSQCLLWQESCQRRLAIGNIWDRKPVIEDLWHDTW